MAGEPVPAVSVTEASKRLTGGSDALLIDVREADEFIALRVAGAVLLPLSRFGIGFRELPRDRPLLMFCRSGSRSEMATDFLRAQGFADVHNVSGGVLAWRGAGLPLLSGPLAPGEGEMGAPGVGRVVGTHDAAGAEG